MGRVLKASISFFVFLALFASANHCALEEFFSTASNDSSNCCPAEQSEHPHGIPCKELTAVESKFTSTIASVELKSSPLQFLTTLSHHLLTEGNENDSDPALRRGFDSKIVLSPHELILSPNAPPVA